MTTCANLTGTFAGTTALSIALVLPEDGQMVTIDFKEDWVATGRPIWEKVRSDLDRLFCGNSLTLFS